MNRAFKRILLAGLPATLAVGAEIGATQGDPIAWAQPDRPLSSQVADNAWAAKIWAPAQVPAEPVQPPFLIPFDIIESIDGMRQ